MWAILQEKNIRPHEQGWPDPTWVSRGEKVQAFVDRRPISDDRKLSAVLPSRWRSLNSHPLRMTILQFRFYGPVQRSTGQEPACLLTWHDREKIVPRSTCCILLWLYLRLGFFVVLYFSLSCFPLWFAFHVCGLCVGAACVFCCLSWRNGRVW